jgi:predicted transcriptional regulator
MVADYDAAGGLFIDSDGKMIQPSVSELATLAGINRTTVYNWRKDIPNYQDIVKKRRGEIFTQERVNKIWAAVYLRARKGDFKQAEMILSHYDDYVPPTQKVEVDVETGLADIMQLVRKKKQQVKTKKALTSETGDAGNNQR